MSASKSKPNYPAMRHSQPRYETYKSTREGKLETIERKKARKAKYQTS